jgi:hypothetical protein
MDCRAKPQARSRWIVAAVSLGHRKGPDRFGTWHPRRIRHGAALPLDRNALLPGDQRPLPAVATVAEHPDMRVVRVAVQVDAHHVDLG